MKVKRRGSQIWGQLWAQLRDRCKFGARTIPSGITSGINDGRGYDNDVYSMLFPPIQSELLSQQQTLPLFLTSLFRINEYTDKNEENAQNTDANSPKNGEFFEKITCEPYNKDGFPQIGYCFGNKLNLLFVHYLHVDITISPLTKSVKRFFNMPRVYQVQATISLCLLFVAGSATTANAAAIINEAGNSSSLLTIKKVEKIGNINMARVSNIYREREKALGGIR